MITRAMFSVWAATGYLFIYCLLLQFYNTLPYAFMMLLFSPVVIIWMVYTVLKYGKYQGPSLGADEFGYQDREKESLGVF